MTDRMTEQAAGPGSGGDTADQDAQVAASRVRSSGLRGVGQSLMRLRELSVVLVTVVLFLYFAIGHGSAFTSVTNLGNIASYVAAPAIIAAGEVMLLVCGEIDLSAGMTFAMTPILMMLLHNNQGLPLLLAFLIALLVAATFGLFNGLVTVFLRLPSFITTLGTLYLVHGLTLKVNSSQPESAPQGGTFMKVFGDPNTWWSEIAWAIGLVIIMQIVLTNTKWGAYTIAAGGNYFGAAEAGIKVRVIKIRAFVITALFAGFAGVLDGIHTPHSFDPNAGGNDLMFTAVAASVIGGTALLGGSGTVIGAFFGALLLGILQDGFNIISLSAETFIMVEGLAIIAAMVLNTQLTRFRRGARAE